MNIANIKEMDITNGDGIRLSLFVSGCEHACKDCFNKEAWDFNYGVPYDSEIFKTICKTLEKPYIDGVSILGGEPLHPRNFRGVVNLMDSIKEKFPSKTIWLWTGYTLHNIIQMYDITKLRNIDILIDGKFIKELYDANLLYRGSSNQKVINFKEFLKYYTQI